MSVRELLPTKQTVFTAFLVILLFSSAGAATATATMNFGASAAHDAHIATDVTKSSHPMSWGTSDAAAVKYESNGGEVVSAEAEVNRSMSVDDIGTGHVNPYQFTVTDVNFTDARAFPHDKDESAIGNESAWTLIGANSSKASVASVETANNVEALELATDGSMASGDVAGAEYTNFSVTSDVDKRYLQLALDVSTLDSGAVVTVRAKDADGDYVEAEINTSETASNEDVITNATGEGFVFQRQIGQMTVAGSGDGTMAEIQEIEIRVNDADATIQMSALNVEKTGKWMLGEERVDTDDEDDFETNTIYEVHSGGDISVHSLSTLGSTFDNAVIHGLTIPMNFQERDLQDTQDFSVSYSEAKSYPAYDWKPRPTAGSNSPTRTTSATRTPNSRTRPPCRPPGTSRSSTRRASPTPTSRTSTTGTASRGPTTPRALRSQSTARSSRGSRSRSTGSTR